MIHTWRRLDGSYYDGEEPEGDDDEQLPLRPSEGYNWNGRQWVLRHGDFRHAAPRLSDSKRNRDREDDCEHVLIGSSDLKALLHVIQLHEERMHSVEHWRAETQRSLGHIRATVDEISASLQGHLTKTEALVEIASDFQAAGRLTKFMYRHIVAVLLFVMVVGIIGWATVKGDFATVRHYMHLP